MSGGVFSRMMDKSGEVKSHIPTEADIIDNVQMHVSAVTDCPSGSYTHTTISVDYEGGVWINIEVEEDRRFEIQVQGNDGATLCLIEALEFATQSLRRQINKDLSPRVIVNQEE